MRKTGDGRKRLEPRMTRGSISATCSAFAETMRRSGPRKRPAGQIGTAGEGNCSAANLSSPLKRFELLPKIGERERFNYESSQLSLAGATGGLCDSRHGPLRVTRRSYRAVTVINLGRRHQRCAAIAGPSQGVRCSRHVVAYSRPGLPRPRLKPTTARGNGVSGRERG